MPAAHTGEEAATARLKYRPELTIAVSVSNLQAARAWYRDVLGLEEGFAVEEAGWIEFAAPVENVVIGLSGIPEGEQHPGASPVNITFGVENVDEARAHLEAKGVQFNGPTNELPGMVRLAEFKDPDGNVMLLAQNLMQP